MIRPKDREIAEILRLIVQRHGKETVEEIPRFCALMNDYIMSPKLKHEKALLRRACTSGVMGLIASASPEQMEFACKRGFYILTVDEFIADEWAKRVIMWISVAFGVEEPQETEAEEAQRAPDPMPITDERSEIERLLDHSNDENVVLLNGNGEETEFEKIAAIEVNQNVYFLLRPLEEVPGVVPGEIMVFVLREEEHEEFLALVTENEVLDLVLDNYMEQKK